MKNKKTYNEIAGEYKALLEKKIALKKKIAQLENDNFAILTSFLKEMGSDFH